MTSGKGLEKSLGISRDKTDIFREYKQTHLHRKNGRFTTKFSKRNSKDETFLETDTSTDAITTIELSSFGTADAKYVAIFDTTLDKLNQFERTLENVKNLGAERIRDQFGDPSRLEKKFETQSMKAMDLLKDCQRNIKKFEQHEKLIDGGSELKFFQNMKNSLKLKVQKSARRLRTEQQKIFKMLNAVENSGSNVDFFADDKQINFLEEEEDLANQGVLGGQAMLEDTSEEIKNIADKIGSLTDLLSQMNEVVMEQGTIVDRIDYNMTVALKTTKKGNKHLQEVRIVK